jgi:predicted methyltransferase
MLMGLDRTSRRAFARGLLGFAGLSHAGFALQGCTPPPPPALPPPDASNHEALLAWAVLGPLRIAPDRDDFRHPMETLSFWGLRPGQTVLELMPGRGWWSVILAPYLAASGGRLIVADLAEGVDAEASRAVHAAFDAHMAQNPEAAGILSRALLTSDAAPLAEPDSVDLVILSRNMHTLMAAGLAQLALQKAFACLKPGGSLGVEQHRASSSGVQDPLAQTGYVQEAYVRELAESVGFSFVGSTDVNANPRDTRDHPFGVWTLPPVLRTAPLGEPDNPNFDVSPYRAIGESDRMTMKFLRPLGDAAEETAP